MKMIVKDLESLKYSELQKLAKRAGIKANQKIDKLMKALTEYYIENEEESIENAEGDASAQNDEQVENLPKEEGARCTQNGTSSDTLTVYDKNITSTDACTTDNTVSKMRRRTFELNEPTLSAHNTPSSDDQPYKRATRQRTSETKTLSEVVKIEEPAVKRIRRNTFDKDTPVEGDLSGHTCSASSPGTKAIIDSIDGNLSNAERKVALMSALDKKVQGKVSSASPATNIVNQPSQIPRFMTFLANKKKTEAEKPVTPGNKDWNKIHNREFSKFDSLDVYLEKKNQRIEMLTGSGKKAAFGKSPGTKRKIIKPVTRPQNEVKPFVPTVTSTKNLNFNFGKMSASQINKTPSKPACAATNKSTIKTPKRQDLAASARKSLATSHQKTTPFIFTGNNSSLNATSTSQKKVFDLKASLAKPLTWKPHTGKLQPLDVNKPVTTSEKKSTFKRERSSRPSRQAMASKMRPVQAKDVRCVQQLGRRNNQKYKDMMKRRGLMA